jgi:hypothetical protein
MAAPMPAKPLPMMAMSTCSFMISLSCPMVTAA